MSKLAAARPMLATLLALSFACPAAAQSSGRRGGAKGEVLYDYRTDLPAPPVVVVATGGGAWALARNRALADARGCLTVWLDAPFELCWRRILNDATARPLARDEQQARRLYDERRASYALARLHVEVRDDTTPETLSAAIADALETDGSTHE